MNVLSNDTRCCILIRGLRSSTTEENILNYCKKYGQINSSRCAVNSHGYIVVFKHEQSVNRFMDTRPHRIDKQTVKVQRCVSSNEEWRLTNTILLTTTDNSLDREIVQEQILCDYFCKYGIIRSCQLDTYQNKPCAYLTFMDYDRVDQLINDKPHMINKTIVHIQKYFSEDLQKTKHHDESSNENEKKKFKCNQSELTTLENEYDKACQQLTDFNHDKSNDEFLIQLEHNVENLQPTKKTFNEQLFDKYTIDYILSLTNEHIQQRLIELEKETHLLLLIKQNMPL